MTNLPPTGMSSIITYTPKLYETQDADTVNSSGDDDPQADGSASEDGLASLESRFARLAASFSQQVGALERSLRQAMRDVGRSAKGALGAADSSAAAPSAATQARVGSAGASARPCPARFLGLINDAAARNEVDPALVSAVVRQESDFQPRAVSSAGALGLMQLMPDTARSLGLSNPMDPAQNIDGGTRLLRSLLDRYRGRIDLALAAYNAGPGAVDKCHGVPPYSETQAYVKNILAAYRANALTS